MKAMRGFFIVISLFIFSCQSPDDSDAKELSCLTPITDSLNFISGVNAQGHRGARGLLPENSIPGFLEALEYPVNTLELDVVISKENKVIVSHEAWFNHKICLHPDGSSILESEEMDLKIYEMTYDEIKQFDCGIIGNPEFPSQVPLSTHKPSLEDVVIAVDEYCEEIGRVKPEFSIEIKSSSGAFSPPTAEYVTIVLNEINELGIKDRSYLQSFSSSILNEIFLQDSTFRTAYLVSNFSTLEENLDKINFTPTIYSPALYLLDQDLINELHQKNIQVLPWTLNNKENINSFIEQGIDGFITDYPNLIDEL